MNTALHRTHAHLSGTRNWLIAAVAAAVVSVAGYSGIRAITSADPARPTVEPATAVDASGLGAALGVQYATTETTPWIDTSGLGEILAVDWTVTPTYAADTSLGTALSVQYPTAVAYDTSLGDALAVRFPTD